MFVRVELKAVSRRYVFAKVSKIFIAFGDNRVGRKT